MGKVGSKSIELSLQESYKSAGIEIPIFHVHVLNDFDKWRQQAMEERVDPKPTFQAMEIGENIRAKIEENSSQHWNIVSLVRDPMARNIAAFFQNISDFIPDWHERYLQGQPIIDELQRLLMTVPSLSEQPNDWFDRQVKQIPAFSIDVFDEPFPHEKGYKIYSGKKQASLLVMRLENLNDCAHEAIKEFLGLENFILKNTNMGEEKDYAELYRTFKQTPLPLEYVRKIYDTKFACHFYNEFELKTFIKRWT